MKVRCAYCKAEFTVKTYRGVRCPSCARVVLLPTSSRPPWVNSSQRGRAGDRLALGRSVAPLALARMQRPLFTLGLAIAVVVGLAILLAPGRSSGPYTIASAPEEVARRELIVLQAALARFALDCKRYPDAGEGLAALLNNPGLFGWKGPYVTLLRNDPWGRPYLYRPDADIQGGIIVSAGPDGIGGSADDIRPPPLDGRALETYLRGPA